MRCDMTYRASHLVSFLDVVMGCFQAVQAQETEDSEKKQVPPCHLRILMRIRMEVKVWMDDGSAARISETQSMEYFMAQHAFDADENNFEETVLKCEKPVVVDFWAPWCGPCKILKPMLEKLAGEGSGRFLLAKVNSDENPELARKYNVRGIPDVRVFVKGEIVDGFTGALPESALRAFLEKAIPSPSEELRLRAKALEPESARNMLMEALRIDPSNERARLDLAEILVDGGAIEPAKALLQAINPGMSPHYERILKKIEYSGAKPEDESALTKAIEADPENLEARIGLAMFHASRHKFEPAFGQLLEVVKKDKKNEKARKMMIDLFDLCDQKELVSRYRKQLASALH